MATSQLILTAGTTPPTPSAGKLTIFANSSKVLSQVDDAGLVKPLIGATVAYANTPGNPTGTTNTTGLMMGLAGSITPALTGRILYTVNGNMSNSTAAAGDGAKTQLYYGTGSAPANGAALTGNPVGSVVAMVLERATASDPLPFSITFIVQSLVVGTTYWLDVSLAAVTGGTAVLTNLAVSAIEL